MEESKHYRPPQYAKSKKVKLELALRSNQQAEVLYHLVEYSMTEHTEPHLLAIARKSSRQGGGGGPKKPNSRKKQ